MGADRHELSRQRPTGNMEHSQPGYLQPWPIIERYSTPSPFVHGNKSESYKYGSIIATTLGENNLQPRIQI